MEIRQIKRFRTIHNLTISYALRGNVDIENELLMHIGTHHHKIWCIYMGTKTVMNE